MLSEAKDLGRRDPSPPSRLTMTIELKIKVVPGARRSEVVGMLGDRLKIRIAAPAEEGKANRALIELLSELLETRDIEIVAGHGSAQKTVRAGGVSPTGEKRLRGLTSS